VAIVVALRHLGPGPHPAGSPQAIHGKEGSGGMAVHEDAPSYDDLTSLVKSAIDENPIRRIHGTKSVFWLIDGKAYSWGKDVPYKPDGIMVHSHSSSNWDTYDFKTPDKLEPFNPLNSGDIQVLKHLVKYGQGNAMALIMADGRMEVLSVPKSIPKSKLDAFMKVPIPKIAKAIELTYAQQKATDFETCQAEREALREFAKTYGLKFKTGLKWR